MRGNSGYDGKAAGRRPGGMAMARLRVKRVYEPAGPDDGFRVLVDRLWPRGVTKDEAHLDLWAKDVAPSRELRRWFGHDPSKWAEFQRRYRAELADTEALDGLREAIAGRSRVTLLYGAKSEEHNHALVLLKVLGGRERSG